MRSVSEPRGSARFGQFLYLLDVRVMGAGVNAHGKRPRGRL